MTEPQNENAEQGGEIEPIGKPGIIRQSRADMRAIKAVELRTKDGRNYVQIGKELDITPEAARAAYYRGLKLVMPKDAIEEARNTALARLDTWTELTMDLFKKEYYLVNFGKVALDQDNKPMIDPGPQLACLDRLLKIESQRMKILGYASPNRRVLEVITSEQVEAAIAQMTREAEALEREAQRRENNESNIIDVEAIDDLPEDEDE